MNKPHVIEFPLAVRNAVNDAPAQSQFSAEIRSKLDLKDFQDLVIAEMLGELDRQDSSIKGVRGVDQVQASARRMATLRTLYDVLGNRELQPRKLVNKVIHDVGKHVLVSFRDACLKLDLHHDAVTAAFYECLADIENYVEHAQKAVERGCTIEELEEC